MHTVDHDRWNKMVSRSTGSYNQSFSRQDQDSIFMTSSSIILDPGQLPRKVTREESLGSFDSDASITQDSIQSNMFHVMRFFFCILQMLLILAHIIVTVTGVRCLRTFQEITYYKDEVIYHLNESTPDY